MSATSPAKLLACVAGIYTFYLYYGVYQEKVWKPDPDTGDRFASTAFLLLCQCACNALFALAGTLVLGCVSSPPPPAAAAACKAPHEPAEGAPGYLRALCGKRLTGNLWMGAISLFYVAAMGCSNQALQHVNYPTQALGKSCKMIPIMVFNVLINGTRYSFVKKASAALITGGIVVFRVFKSSSKAAGANSSLGLLLLLASLCLDGLTASNQKVYRAEFSSPTLKGSLRMMLQTNLWACVHVGAVALVTGDLATGFGYIVAHPYLIEAVVSFALCSACGQFFIFFTITGPGPLACTTITTTRKFFTILLSVFMNPENTLTQAQWGGVGLVFCGLGGELYEKFEEKQLKDEKKREKLRED